MKIFKWILLVLIVQLAIASAARRKSGSRSPPKSRPKWSPTKRTTTQKPITTPPPNPPGHGGSRSGHSRLPIADIKGQADTSTPNKQPSRSPITGGFPRSGGSWRQPPSSSPHRDGSPRPGGSWRQPPPSSPLLDGSPRPGGATPNKQPIWRPRTEEGGSTPNKEPSWREEARLREEQEHQHHGNSPLEPNMRPINTPGKRYTPVKPGDTNSPLEPSMRPGYTPGKLYTPGKPSDNTKTPEDLQGANARIPEDIRQTITGAKKTDEVDGVSLARRQLFPKEYITACQQNPFLAGCKAPASDLDDVASRDLWDKKLQLNGEEAEAKESCPHKAYLKKHACAYCVSDSQVEEFAWLVIEKNFREIHDVFTGPRSYKVNGKYRNKWQCVPDKPQVHYRCSFVDKFGSMSKENFKCEKLKNKFTPIHFTSNGHYNYPKYPK